MADYLSKAEFSRCLAHMQRMREQERIDLVAFMSGDMEMFIGFMTRGFEPVACTLDQLATLICYQSLQFNGDLDQNAINEIWQARRKFLLIGEGSDEVEQSRLYRQNIIDQLEKAELAVA